MRGRMSKEWGEIVQEHYERTTTAKHLSRETWENATLAKIWAIFDATWNARNGLVHGKNDEENQQIREQQINEKIQDIYRYDRNNIAPQDQKLLQTPLILLLHKTLAYKNAWMKSITIAKTTWETEQGADNPIDRGPPPPI